MVYLLNSSDCTKIPYLFPPPGNRNLLRVEHPFFEYKKSSKVFTADVDEKKVVDPFLLANYSGIPNRASHYELLLVSCVLFFFVHPIRSSGTIPPLRSSFFVHSPSLRSSPSCTHSLAENFKTYCGNPLRNPASSCKSRFFSQRSETGTIWQPASCNPENVSQTYLKSASPWRLALEQCWKHSGGLYDHQPGTCCKNYLKHAAGTPDTYYGAPGNPLRVVIMGSKKQNCKILLEGTGIYTFPTLPDDSMGNSFRSLAWLGRSGLEKGRRGISWDNINVL